MIYFDNAATTSPKPLSVIKAADYAMSALSANPGRSGHTLSVKAADTVYACRQKLADFFGFANSERIVFTKNCTEALNTVIKGLELENCEVIISSFEHNSVSRPLFSLKKKGVITKVAKVYFYDEKRTVESFESLMNERTRLVVCTHASNVCGCILPVGKIGGLCRKKKIPFCVDAAQSAGVLDINTERDCIDFLCLPGHKGLYAPMGTGALLCGGELSGTLTEGGTGNFSHTLYQPDDLPERLESGTLNLPGIAGVSAGIDFVKAREVKRIFSHEKKLASMLYRELGKIPGVILYGEDPEKTTTAPVVSFNLSDTRSEELAAELSRRGFAVRAGLHCSPLAHKSLGTLKNGTVRVSFSVFNRPDEVALFTKNIKNI